MKTYQYLITSIAVVLLAVLSGCQSSSRNASSNDSLDQPVPLREAMLKGEYSMIEATDTPPKAAEIYTRPHYPLKLQRQKISGEAIIVFIVSEKGKPEQVQAIRATHAGFAEEAVKAVKLWRFTPATKNGKPVKCKMQVPIAFHLNN
ncbi:TonB family protein [Ereboglobus sp. PH5-10]|uniref:energy transducer TonB n=1 Tax=Ereboglobus sp. PH5-10 TaxID=2940629 RepID=UPI0024077109|nr:energy transducer TonB [Ereboglobus sp. PH5-10]MDF9826931.1 TonB family protein [Ereboglobus sp. PH5-10]